MHVDNITRCYWPTIYTGFRDFNKQFSATLMNANILYIIHHNILWLMYSCNSNWKGNVKAAGKRFNCPLVTVTWRNEWTGMGKTFSHRVLLIQSDNFPKAFTIAPYTKESDYTRPVKICASGYLWSMPLTNICSNNDIWNYCGINNNIDHWGTKLQTVFNPLDSGIHRGLRLCNLWIYVM